MDRKILAGAITFAIIVGIGIVAFGGYHGNSGALINSGGSAQTAGGSTPNQTTTNSSKTLFASTQYYPYSYVVYPSPISQQAHLALAGFNLTATALQNSSTEITLTLIGTNQYQNIVLKPNCKLYIIEATFGDDGYHFDSSLGDDGFVVVDANGYVA